ncbi:hypothetical protein BH11BAC1_BH11BAC1_21620 [soil metagenome]
MTTKSIFITGLVAGADTSQLDEFILVQQKLEQAGFKVTTAIDDLPMGDQLGNKDAENLYLKKRAENLSEADNVIYLDNYELDERALNDLRVARAAVKEHVMPAKKFIAQYAKEAVA